MGDLSQMDLFSKKYSMKIEKIYPSDVRVESDKYKLFYNLVKSHEDMYPDINKWLKYKAFKGILSGERVGYMGFSNEKPIVSAILKKGFKSKFCHLHIEKQYQNMGIGDIFFSMMAIEVRNESKDVYFTLPESLWEKKKLFFKSFGFKMAVKSDTQYRKFEKELLCKAQFESVWRNVLNKIPKLIESSTSSNLNVFDGLLLSIKPKFVKKLINGEKIVEIRKRFSPKWRGCKAFIYSTSPVKALYGHSTIKYIDKGQPEFIWKKYEGNLGCTKEEFFDYTGDSNNIYAITMNSFSEFIAPLFLEQLSFLLKKDLLPPQSYLSLANSKKWSEAISIAQLLDGKFQLYCQNDINTL